VTPFIVISAADNVATALEQLETGRVLTRDGPAITVREAIPRGHKVALVRIEAGAAVVKYGSSIGVATEEIPAGAHVHTHNVSSARGRGDLAAENGKPIAVARLAEPLDDRREA
jgi:altronate hydrolase